MSEELVELAGRVDAQVRAEDAAKTPTEKALAAVEVILQDPKIVNVLRRLAQD
jgi:hypothetical protein